MAEQAQTRVQKAVNELVNELDRTHLRKVQGDMHRCAANCCDNGNFTLEQVHRCIEDCSKDITSAQNFVQEELNNYQNRLQRCVISCQDSIRDKIVPSTTDEEMNKHKANFEKCVIKCADTHVDLIPGLLVRMREILLSKRY
ncbi:hypothetical protein CHUAL_008008 [Chamberlinius hualienensis]